jgi:hypothetical protein
MMRHFCCAVLLLETLCGFSSRPSSAEEPGHWQTVKSADGWRLLKNGEPFYVQGAVGWNQFEVLKACGGNAVRATANRATLDAAQREGLAVMANLPVRGERNGLDWSNAQQEEEQKRKVLTVVRELKDHPAVMFWAIGNELDHIPGKPSYHPQLWDGLNDLAVAIKQIDTNHPVLTVVGTGRYERKIKEIAAACKDMDLLGVNAYGDLGPVTELTRKHWPKPYVVAEWGPTGHWQVPKTSWRAPLEQTSSEKAQVIAERYERIILADRTHCLGSFVFYWSEKQETTHTWYGLFCHGSRTESIDVMQRFWSGAWPANRAPAIGGLAIDGFPDPRSVTLQAGKTYRAEVQVTDPESDPLTFAWDIRPEVEIPAGSYAGSMEKKAEPIAGLIRDPACRQIEFTAPQTAGPYRLFVSIADGNGHVAYGNIPFLAAE